MVSPTPSLELSPSWLSSRVCLFYVSFRRYSRLSVLQCFVNKLNATSTQGSNLYPISDTSTHTTCTLWNAALEHITYCYLENTHSRSNVLAELSVRLGQGGGLALSCWLTCSPCAEVTRAAVWRVSFVSPHPRAEKAGRAAVLNRLHVESLREKAPGVSICWVVPALHSTKLVLVLWFKWECAIQLIYPSNYI